RRPPGLPPEPARPVEPAPGGPPPRPRARRRAARRAGRRAPGRSPPAAARSVPRSHLLARRPHRPTAASDGTVPTDAPARWPSVGPPVAACRVLHRRGQDAGHAAAAGHGAGHARGGWGATAYPRSVDRPDPETLAWITAAVALLALLLAAVAWRRLRVLD